MKAVILGQNGQLAWALQQQLAPIAHVTCLGRSSLDLSNLSELPNQLKTLEADLIINAAAYTAVDRAETESEQAFAINASAPRLIAEEAKRRGIPLIHYSTDYVFDGQKTSAYTEADTPAPLNVYGASKLAGEQGILSVGGQALILRTSWVYSLQGQNFLLTMQRLLQERAELRVVDDQIGAPTWTGSIAQASVQLIQHWQQGKPLEGLFHLSAQGNTSWYGFACAIRENLLAQGRTCGQLLAIPATDYPTPAKRPRNSRLDCSALMQHWGIQLPDWKTALQDCLK